MPEIKNVTTGSDAPKPTFAARVRSYGMRHLRTGKEFMHGFNVIIFFLFPAAGINSCCAGYEYNMISLLVIGILLMIWGTAVFTFGFMEQLRWFQHRHCPDTCPVLKKTSLIFGTNFKDENESLMRVYHVSVSVQRAH